MNIFQTILQKIGIEKPAAPVAPAAPAPAAPVAPAAPAAPAPAAPAPETPAMSAPAPAPASPATFTPAAVGFSAPTPAPANPATFTPAAVGFSAPASSAPSQPTPMAMVDVVSKLDAMARKRPDLNWKVSIVDLLKLLDMDASYRGLQDLAKELDCPDFQMADSARMNVWLHQTVLHKIAENGGNIPANLLHH